MKPDYFLTRRVFAALDPPYSDFEACRVVILPIPYDSTTEWRSGARDGPQAIIDASQFLELYDLELGREIHTVGIHTLAELEPVMSGPEGMVGRVYEVARELLDEGKLVVMLGGEHSLTLGLVRALRERFERLSVLQLDAHADLRDHYLGTGYSHACVMRRILELCPIVPAGVRSLSQEEHEFIVARGMEHLYAQDPGGQASLDSLLGSLSPEVYITIDLDVLDPSAMPAVGTPEPGGMGWGDLLRLLRAVARERRVVGFDVMELCPSQGPGACAFLAAKLAYKLIGYATLV